MGDGDSVKLFIGQVPREWGEKDLREVFEKYGEISHMKIITDRETGRTKGCAFLTYKDSDSAKQAQEDLHEKTTLPGARSAVQVKPAESEKDEFRKLYVGNISRRCDEEHLTNMFARYGTLEDVSVLKNADGRSRGSAFVKFQTRQQAQKAIKALHESETMPGCRYPLVVKIADTERDKAEKRRLQQNTNPNQDGGFQTQPIGQQNILNSLQQQQPTIQIGANGLPTIAPSSALGGALVLPAGQNLQQQLLAQMALPQLLAGTPSIVAAAPGVAGAGLIPGLSYLQQPFGAVGSTIDPSLLQSSYILPQTAQGAQITGLAGLAGGIGTFQNPIALGGALGTLSQLPTAQVGALQSQLAVGGAQNALQTLQNQLNTSTAQSVGLGAAALQSQLGVQNQLSGNTVQNQLGAAAQSPLAGSAVQGQHLGSNVQNALGASTHLSTTTNLASAYGLGNYAALGGSNTSALSGVGTLADTVQQVSSQPYATQGSQSYSSNSRPATGSVRKEGQGPEGANLFIYQVPPEFNDDDLVSYFQPYGSIVSAKIFVDKSTGASKGFGFVSYDSPASANAAISAMNGVQIGSRRLRVQHKRPKEQGRPY